MEQSSDAELRVAEARLLQRQGRFAAAIAVAERVPAGDPLHAAAQLLVFRVLLEQGHLARAARHAGERLRAPVDGEDGARLRLWTGFFARAGLLPGLTANPGTLEREVGAVLADPGASPSLRALGLDFRARMDTIRWIPAGGYAPHLRAPLADAYEAAAHAYDEAGEPHEGDDARRRAVDLLRHPAGGDPARAVALLESTVARAAAAADRLREGVARLARAEPALEACLARGSEDPEAAAAALAGFTDAARFLEAGGHAFPEALVQRSLARLLLRHGADGGAVLAAEAARAFEAAGAATAARDLWVELVRWHKQHGQPGPEAEAMDGAMRCAADIGAPVVSRAEELATADGALRVGNVAEAGRVLARGEGDTGYPAQLAANGVIRSNALAAGGRRAEAVALLRGVIAGLPPEQPTSILFQAWEALSTHLQASDPAAAVDAATRAVAVARAAGERVNEAQGLGQRGWLRAWAARERGEPGVPAAAHADFDAAAAVLEGVFTLEARLELANLHQSRGLALFYANELQPALDELARTETIVRAYGVGPSVAFVATQQGLVLRQVGRRAGLEAYDAARERHAEALEWFDRCGLRAMRWQVLYFRAACDVEAAWWEPPEGGAARDRRTRAMADLREAAQEIDRLRGMADADSAAVGQPVRMAFGVDKAKVYALGLDLALLWGDPAEALRWLERGKGRALLDALAESAPAADEGAGGAARAILLRSADPPSWPELRDLLRREEREAGGRRVVVAQWAATPGRTLLFGMRADWSEPRVERVEVDGEALDAFARTHYRTPGAVRMLMADHGARGEEYWARFAPLVAPLAAWTGPDDVVCLVPHGPLHDLPLHVLPVDGVPLGLRNPVFYAPAAALLRHTLGREGRPPGGGAAVFGDPSGDLPGARAEAAAVGLALGTAPLLGDRVTRAAVLTALRTARVLHFAGHADASADDGFEAGLMLAGGDVLRAREILSVRTGARLVVLGGCETGVSEHRPGDELAGLARALLVAGAGALVVSLWRVADASTEALLRDVHHRAEAGAPLAEALRGAMAAVRSVAGWEHFYHWGGFVMIGQWR